MSEDRIVSSASRHYLALTAGLVLLLAIYHGVMVWKFGVAPIDGRTYFLLDDDPMISMRYGRNLAQGVGLVYNAGERVEGFTNPLFTFLCAGLHLLPVPEPMLPLVVDAVNLLLSVGILLMLTRFWGTGPQERFAGLAAALFYVTCPAHSYYAHAGFEVYTVMFLLVFALWRIERLTVPGALLVGLLPLTHGTALPMWAVLVAGIFFVTPRPRKSRLILMGAAALPFVCYEVFRIAYYHQLLPNTYWLKAGGGSLSSGLHYANGWFRSLWPLVPLGVYAVAARPSRKMVLTAAVLLVHLAGVIALGGDIFPQFRFLLPCSVLLAALAGASIAPLLRYFTYMSRGEQAYFGTALATLLVLGVVREPLAEYRFQSPEYEESKHWNIRHIALGLAIRDNTPPDAVVGLFGLGYTGYYGNRRTIDLLGKADAHIARVKPIPGRLIGHNKLDFDYALLQRQPDYLEMEYAPGELDNRPQLLSISHSSRWGYWEDLALHRAFRDRYAPFPVRDRQGRFALFYGRSSCPGRTWRVSEALYENLPEGHTY